MGFFKRLKSDAFLGGLFLMVVGLLTIVFRSDDALVLAGSGDMIIPLPVVGAIMLSLGGIAALYGIIKGS